LIPGHFFFFSFNLSASGSRLNPSYLGGWTWEDHSLRTAKAKTLQDPISKIGGVVQAVACLLCKTQNPEFKH
jgi:hypothetical protein